MVELTSPADSSENNHYFEEHSLNIYFEDAVTQMLSLRTEWNKMKPGKFFKEYFCSVHQGTHILFREYSFVSATLYNRLCVLKAIIQIFKPLIYKDDKLRAQDCHALLQLVWPDFELNIVRKAFETDTKTEDARLSFLDFVMSLKYSFCEGEFDFEANIINFQLEVKIEEFIRSLKFGDKGSANFAESGLLCPHEENCTDVTLSWSKTSDIGQNSSEFKRIQGLKESNSFSSDEHFDKLSRSSSGSKDASRSEQNVSIFSRASSASLQGRLSGKQLSNSLTLLQTEKFDTENNFATRRHRSKSAVAIQRCYPPNRS